MATPKLMHSTFWYTVGNLVVRTINFLLLPIYSNLISAEQFGKYSLLISFSVILSALYQFGFPSGLSAFYIEEQNKNKRKVIFSTSINILTINSIIISLIIFLFAQKISGLLLGEQGNYKLVQILFISVMIDTVTTQILQLLKTREESKKVILYSIIGSLLNFLLNIVFVVKFNLDVFGIILAQLISSVVVFLVLIPTLKLDYKFLIDAKIAKRLFIFCFPIFLAGIFNYGTDVIDRFFLSHYFNQEVVGVYSFSYRIAMVMNLLVISFRTAWIPHSLNLYHSKNFSENFGKSFTNLVSISLMLLIIGTLLYNDLFNLKIGDELLFDPSYSEGSAVIPFILLGYFFNGIASFYYVYPLTQNRSIHFIYADGLGLLINIFSNILLIPLLGMIGAAVSTSLSYFAIAAYMYLISKKTISVNYQKEKLVKLFLIALIFIAAGILLNQILTDIVFIILFYLSISFVTKINLLKAL